MRIKTLHRSKMVVSLAIASVAITVFAYQDCYVDTTSGCASFEASAFNPFAGNDWTCMYNVCTIDGTWPDTKFAATGSWTSEGANTACAGTCSGMSGTQEPFTISTSDPNNVGGYYAD